LNLESALNETRVVLRNRFMPVPASGTTSTCSHDAIRGLLTRYSGDRRHRCAGDLHFAVVGGIVIMNIMW